MPYSVQELTEAIKVLFRLCVAWACRAGATSAALITHIYRDQHRRVSQDSLGIYKKSLKLVWASYGFCCEIQSHVFRSWVNPLGSLPFVLVISLYFGIFKYRSVFPSQNYRINSCSPHHCSSPLFRSSLIIFKPYLNQSRFCSWLSDWRFHDLLGFPHTLRSTE